MAGKACRPLDRACVPPDVHRPLRRALEADEMTWTKQEVESLETEGDQIRLRFATNEVLNVDRVLLATGFGGARPGGAWVDEMIEAESLPCAECGYPVVDAELRWHSGLFVSGPLAELEIGPVSRNIAGARRAGDRIVAAVAKS